MVNSFFHDADDLVSDKALELENLCDDVLGSVSATRDLLNSAKGDLDYLCFMLRGLERDTARSARKNIMKAIKLLG